MGGQACVLYGAAEFSRDTDRRYWQPLKDELQRLRRERNTEGQPHILLQIFQIRETDPSIAVSSSPGREAVWAELRWPRC